MPDLHRHTCPCGTSWEHDGDSFDLDLNFNRCKSPDDLRALHEANVKGHTCPNCGGEVYIKDHPILGAPPAFVIHEHRRELARDRAQGKDDIDYNELFGKITLLRKLGIAA